MKRLSRIAAGLLVVSLTAGCAYGLRSGWVTLFDGSNLDHWTRLGGANWRIVDGVVQADSSTSKGASFLVSKQSYKDFDLRVEFWVSDDANSGVFLRCANRNEVTDRNCYEANIFDKRPDPSYGTGGIVHRAIVNPMPKAGGKWNVMEIEARGPQLTVRLNGQQTATVSDNKHARGRIALQYGAGKVMWRKVEIQAQ